jgi:hypothetical protein
MVLAAELHPERHHDMGHVAPAVDGVTAGQRQQRGDRIGLLLGRPTHLAPPGEGAEMAHLRPGIWGTQVC